MLSPLSRTGQGLFFSQPIHKQIIAKLATQYLPTSNNMKFTTWRLCAKSKCFTKIFTKTHKVSQLCSA
ncbi:hypothetical protein D0C16_17790 [Cellvibrio sp. KY-GH-1]|nr:hypothetical protein D0C16_17790 [Cellvibrio sp. KY-GH-1]